MSGNMDNKVNISQLDKITDEHWRLLLLADPSKQLVQQYLQHGTTFEVRKSDQVVAIMVVEGISPTSLEIKNIAVDPKFENQGIATKLLNYALDFAKGHQYRQVQIGTGSTSFKQLYLYQKVGFRITSIRKDFFVKNYQHPIYENGLLLRDMVVLVMNL